MKLNYFNYKKIDGKYLLTNDFGKFIFLTEEDFENLLQRKIKPDTELGSQLIKRNFIYDGNSIEFAMESGKELLDNKMYMGTATSLHIFVVTTACNLNCVYCQANNGKRHATFFMTKEIAKRAVDIALQSPEKYLSFEFQGGEPLLNFPIIKYIVEYSEKHCGFHRISFSLVSNLTLLTGEILQFLKDHNVALSTSLDGPQGVHDKNRPFPTGAGSYLYVKDAVEKCKSYGLPIGAIETTTEVSLKYPRELVETYNEFGFDSIFVRPLTPLGKASPDQQGHNYSAEAFLDFYRKVWEEIISLYRNGKIMREQHAEIFLKRIFGSPVNYMELRSPCGGGIGQLAYYADGHIFTCDEGRMLFEMGNSAFLLGDVFHSRYCDLIQNGVCKTVCASSILESIPGCTDCVYQPYCGVCPVINYALDADVIAKRPRGFRCQIYQGLLDNLFTALNHPESDAAGVIRSWGFRNGFNECNNSEA
jgi:uncharacterized protein